jgi:hypothetical protein
LGALHLTTQFSNMGGHNGDGFGDPYAERGTHGRQHHEQVHANQWGNRFKLNIPEFQGDLQPKEFIDWVLAVEEVFEFNGVPDEQKSLWWYTHFGEELLRDGNN